MKKIIITLLFIFILVGCKAQPHEISTAIEFDKIIAKSVVRYDLRTYEECSDGHIPGFLCIDNGDLSSVEQAIYNITNKYSNYKKSDIIVLISKNTIDAQEAASQLAKKGFKNIYYFRGGYDEYVNQKGDDFEPEVGCDC